jgi:hypothetical protein
MRMRAPMMAKLRRLDSFLAFAIGRKCSTGREALQPELPYPSIQSQRGTVTNPKKEREGAVALDAAS